VLDHDRKDLVGLGAVSTGFVGISLEQRTSP
jgi:hypothetical protein